MRGTLAFDRCRWWWWFVCRFYIFNFYLRIMAIKGFLIFPMMRNLRKWRESIGHHHGNGWMQHRMKVFFLKSKNIYTQWIWECHSKGLTLLVVWYSRNRRKTSILTWFVCHWHEFWNSWLAPTVDRTHFRIDDCCFFFRFCISRSHCTSTDSISFFFFIIPFQYVVIFQLWIFAVNIIPSFINSHQITVDSLHFTLLLYHICCDSCCLFVMNLHSNTRSYWLIEQMQQHWDMKPEKKIWEMKRETKSKVIDFRNGRKICDAKYEQLCNWSFICIWWLQRRWCTITLYLSSVHI